MFKKLSKLVLNQTYELNEVKKTVREINHKMSQEARNTVSKSASNNKAIIRPKLPKENLQEILALEEDLRNLKGTKEWLVC